jgi:hypothetical protein
VNKFMKLKHRSTNALQAVRHWIEGALREWWLPPRLRPRSDQFRLFSRCDRDL